MGLGLGASHKLVVRSGLCWAGILHTPYLLTTGFVFESTLTNLGYRRTEALWQASVCSLDGLNAFLLSQACSRRQRGPDPCPNMQVPLVNNGWWQK